LKQTKKERTQKDLLTAAKSIILDKGHESLTVRSLAEVTGYSYTNLYYYFKDMNTLLWILRLEMIEDMITSLSSISMKKNDPVEELQESFFCYTDYFFQHPNIFRFFYFLPFVEPEGDTRYQNLEQRFYGMWQNSFTRLVQEGTVQPDDIPLIAKTIIYSLQGMIMLSFSSNGSMNMDTIKDELSKLIHFLIYRK
jgi:AcrR family transcriptional regulator